MRRDSRDSIRPVPASTDSRAVLRDALRRQLDGEQPVAIGETLPSPAQLTQEEKSAWLMLNNWGCDAELRGQYVAHATYGRERLRHLLQLLQ